MNQISDIRTLLQQYAQVPKEKQSYFFKTGPGHYAEHDKFLGITIPDLRKIAKSNKNLAHEGIKALIDSPYNEERLMALFILVEQYKQGDELVKDRIYQFYISQLSQVNNWNLVDASAPFIVGAHLHQKNKELLLTLAQSQVLWERRIAIVSTLYFIRNNDLEWTFKIAKLLLDDKHDLIHKAVGWMLREAGKKDQNQLINFLEQYAGQMPRTMLRYSIERFPEQQRKIYLNKPRIFNEK
ncbi:DNA alkylation repair protein [Legionella maioricensis]|uniref:DNA alkylation repair protein n=1 Tax=Legionella maioricensis TaxID=2896528 RepID=A0A9X2D2L2_9GAMM|nr:DNA alkylation repair protein [Legionella maioricensis]MCL9685306.1 DNA alkylation repair protein [Legionella maioricensis]MCL9688561.1 DNA alkylation repair protein [Legionella maioricensis]